MSTHERRNGWTCVAAIAAALLSSPAVASSVFGPLDNFDVVNDTGHDECGFEIEIEGVHSADIYRTFDAPYVRYQTPTLIDTPTGVIVHYQGVWDPATQTFVQKTPPAAPGYVPANDSCWTVGLGAAYESAGCEHFGVSQTTQATATRYRWLDCHPDGTVTPGPDLGVPTPTWSVIPPAAPGNPEVVRAEIEIPNPGGDPYGPAYWVKIYKTEADHQIELEELLLDDALIAGAETEIEWELLQAKPGQGAVMNEGPLGAGNDAVIRRYEFYSYNAAWGLANGYVDPENGEVSECVVNGCNDPTPDELGDFVARQMAGVNLAASLCSNGIDDDGDGHVDFPTDPGCQNADANTENPRCQDGLDNDGQPGIDFDGGAAANGGVAIAGVDPQCTQPWLNSETKKSCGLGAELVFVFAALRASGRMAARVARS
jgi:hypothetical protein